MIDNIPTNLHTPIFFLDLAFFFIGLCIMIKYNPLGMCNNYISKKFLLGIYICIITFINLTTPSIIINQIIFITGLGLTIMYNPLQYACYPIKIPKKFLLGILICIISIINLFHLMSFPPS